jgi:hypothetical protein
MMQARHERRERRLERQHEVEAVLRSSVTEEEMHRWQVLSDAVGRVV